MANPLVSIVIVNYNGQAVLKPCLDGVFSQEYRPFEVILVDNASTDGSVEFLRDNFPGLQLVANTVNEGFAGGANTGWLATKGAYVVLLNNDAIVRPGWLGALVEAVQEQRVAIASSLVITEGVPQAYYERNGSLNLVGQNIMRVYSRPENIFYGGGASLIFRKDVFGIPFDREYFAYGEDVYLGLRARFMGHRILHTNASVADHRGSATAQRQKRAMISKLQERNRLLNILLFFSALTLWKALPFVVLNAAAKIAASCVSPRYSLRGVIGAYFWLLTHSGEIRKKKRALDAERRVSDAEVLSWMTAKVTNGESTSGRLANSLALLYCRLVRLKTIEFLPEGSR